MEALYPPVLFIKKNNSVPFQYTFMLKGKLLSEDINELGINIEEILQKGNGMRGIVIDISRSDDYMIKPHRFFGLCSYFIERIKSSGQKIDIKIFINARQKENFKEIVDALDVFEVAAEPEDKTPQSISSRALSNISIHVALISAFVLLGIIFIKGLYIADDVLRFAISFSSGVLLYEVYILLKVYRKKLNDKKNEVVI